MKEFELSDFIRGWLIGDFEPTVFRTKDFEFGVKVYKRGDKEKKHMHKVVDELTVIVSGKFRMTGKVYKSNDIIWIQPGDATDFECLEDGATAIIKIPSVKNDKHVCE